MRFMAYKLYMVDVEMFLVFFHVNKKIVKTVMLYLRQFT